VERHGLIVLIALGESIVTVGVGWQAVVSEPTVSSPRCWVWIWRPRLWWRYFDGEDEQAERVLDAAGVDHTTWLALYGFGYAFLPVLGGIIMFAAGIKNAVGHQAERLAEGVRVAGDLSVSGCG
jgi:low temperature requirement protein LtrA